jgi:hypothetical protein
MPMGGPGSGRWGRGGKADAKALVEDCRELDINRLVCPGVVRPGGRYVGRCSWRTAEGDRRGTLRLDAQLGDEAGTLRLIYRRRRGGEESGRRYDYTIRLVTTTLRSGGRRWWFACPAEGAGGMPCGRRSGKLYLPPRGVVFACRCCHDLTYRSRREGRRGDDP